jgi:hypothetical protein
MLKKGEKHMFKRKFVMIVILLSICCSFIQVSAFDYIDTDFTKNPITNRYMPIPILYDVETVFEKTGNGNKSEISTALNKPRDIFIDDNDDIYVADAGNNRVLKFDKNFKFVLEIKTADGIALNQPSGLYVDKLGDIYIADTLNRRIVHTKKDGSFIESFIKPKTELISKETTFNPEKVILSENQGLIYILFGKQFIVIDAGNNFRGFVGSERVGFSFRDFIVSFIGSKEQKNKIVKREPASFSNVFISGNGTIFATNLGKSDQIKALNIEGKNFFTPGYYGDKTYINKITDPLDSKLIDISVDKDGFITTADANSSYIYIYDNVGNMIGTYGGKGETKGNFTSIVSLDTDSEGKIYVVDGSRNSITVFSPTSFTKQVQAAIISGNNGQYDLSFQQWKNISKLSSNYPIYEKSIGQIYIKKKEFVEAMDLYKSTGDKNGYLAAFSLYRFTIYEKYFGIIFFTAIALIVFAVWVIVKLNKVANRIEDQMWHGRSKY